MLEMVVLPLCHSFPASRFPFFPPSTHLVFWYLRREPENKRKLFRPWEVHDTWRNSPEICHKENTAGSKFGRRLFETYICSLYVKVLMFRITYKAMSHVRCTSWIMAHWHKWDPVFNLPQECSLTPFQNLIRNKENPSEFVPQKTPGKLSQHSPFTPPSKKIGFFGFFGYLPPAGKPIQEVWINKVLLEIARVVRDESHMTKVWVFIGKGSLGV